MGRTKSLYYMMAVAAMMGMMSSNNMFGLPYSKKTLPKDEPGVPVGMKMWRFSDGDKVIAKNFREANEIHKMNKKNGKCKGRKR